MVSKNLKNFVLMSVISALIVLMAVVPYLGYIQITIASFTIIHIPVIIGSVILGKKNGAILGLVFGLSSMFVALIRPTNPIDLLFQNPLVSVLPRVLFGYFTGLLSEKYLYSLDNSRRIFGIALLSSFIHTILVLSMLGVYSALGTNVYETIMNVLLILFGIGAFVEALLAAIIVPSIIKTLKNSDILED